MSMSMISRGFLRLGAVLTLSAALAACGGDDGDDSPPPANGGQPETPAPVPPAPAKPELRCAP